MDERVRGGESAKASLDDGFASGLEDDEAVDGHGAVRKVLGAIRGYTKVT